MLANNDSHHVAVYTAIDLDRTLLRSTTLFYDYIIPALGHIGGFDIDALEQLRDQERAMRGQAFDFIDYAARLASQLELVGFELDMIGETIVESARDSQGEIRDEFVHDVLAEGALELIATLKSRVDEAWGIMTSGGEMTQRLKCQIVGQIVAERCGVQMRAYIIPAENKAQVIADEWYDEAYGRFIVPDTEPVSGRLIEADVIRLIDDKEKNLLLADDTPAEARAKFTFYRAQAAESVGSEGDTLRQIAQKIQQ